MNPKGGTEILKEQLIAQLPKESLDGINLIGSICHPSLIEKDKTNIVWQHLSYDQPNVQYMRDRKYVDSIDYFIYVTSTKIYGSKFEELEKDKFEPLFELCRNTKNVNFKGYTFNGEIRKSLEDTHIYAYPSIFEETSCLAVIEAMSAGCHVVTTNYGALPETCGEFATMIEFDSSATNLIERYAETLNSVLDNYKQNMYKEDLEMQVKYYNKYYSWNTRIQEWRNFLNYARQKTR